MAGISTTAPLKLENRFKYNGIELNHKEFSDESGLDLYSAYFRDLDPQIGRWWQVDPRTTYNLSPYASMNSNPISLVDVLGDTTGLPDAYKGNYNIYSNNILDELIVGGYGNSNYGMNGPLYTGVFFAPTKFIKDDSYNPNLVRTTFTNKVTTEDPKIFYSSLGDRLEINVSNETVTGKEGSILTTNVTYENGEISDVSLALGYKQVKLTHAFDGKNFGIYLGLDLGKTKASFGLSSKGFTSNFTFPNGASNTEIQTFYLPGAKTVLIVGAAAYLVPEAAAILPSTAAEIFGSLTTQ